MTSPQLQRTFLAFREQCIWLQTCYNIYAALFESEKSTKDLLSSTAPLFFHDLNLVLVEYCLLQVCRLTDPPRSVSRDNLTVKNLNKMLQAKGLLTAEISRASDGLAHYRSLINESRNWIVSHADKRTMLQGLPIGAHSATDVAAFFNDLYTYVDAVGQAVGVGPLDFRVTSGPGDVLDLLRFLRGGSNPSIERTA